MDKRKLKDITIDENTPGLKYRGNGFYTYEGDLNARQLNIRVPLVIEGDVYVHGVLHIGSTIICDDINCCKGITSGFDTVDIGYRQIIVKGKLIVKDLFIMTTWLQMKNGSVNV